MHWCPLCLEALSSPGPCPECSSPTMEITPASVVGLTTSIGVFSKSDPLVVWLVSVGAEHTVTYTARPPMETKVVRIVSWDGSIKAQS